MTLAIKAKGLPDVSCVVKVGAGRGFMVEHRFKLPRPTGLPRKLKLRRFTERRLVYTAAHCLPSVELTSELTIPCWACPGSLESIWFAGLIGSLDGTKNSVAAECVFVDPVSDLAVLGCPDGQELGEQADAYDAFVENRAVLRIGEARSGPGWMLSLDGQWVRITVEVHNGWHGGALEIDATEAGQSGSPILNAAGRAVGVVSIGAATINKNGEHKNERCSPQPILRRSLPAWLLER